MTKTYAGTAALAVVAAILGITGLVSTLSKKHADVPPPEQSSFAHHPVVSQAAAAQAAKQAPITAEETRLSTEKATFTVTAVREAVIDYDTVRVWDVNGDTHRTNIREVTVVHAPEGPTGGTYVKAETKWRHIGFYGHDKETVRMEILTSDKANAEAWERALQNQRDRLYKTRWVVPVILDRVADRKP